MHPYATDSNERKIVPFILAALAIAMAWVFGWVLGSLNLRIPWWLDAPSAFAFYGIVYSLMNRKLWRLSVLRTLGLVRVPILEGRWQGQITTSFDEHATRHDVDVRIVQTWTRMKITLRGKDSASESLAATLITDVPSTAILSYQYRNEPLPHAKDTMQIHYGTARLNLSDPGSLEGEYYSGRGRHNHGSIYLTRATK